jgi:hypothetical protein
MTESHPRAETLITFLLTWHTTSFSPYAVDPALVSVSRIVGGIPGKLSRETIEMRSKTTIAQFGERFTTRSLGMC